MAIDGIRFPVNPDSKTPNTESESIVDNIANIRKAFDSAMQVRLSVEDATVYNALAALYAQVEPFLENITVKSVEISKSLGTTFSQNTQQESKNPDSQQKLSDDRIC